MGERVGWNPGGHFGGKAAHVRERARWGECGKGSGDEDGKDAEMKGYGVTEMPQFIPLDVCFLRDGLRYRETSLIFSRDSVHYISWFAFLLHCPLLSVAFYFLFLYIGTNA